eukprot:Hpha_TRINITY_DN15917_c4_g2::TRINITY_DN15917_c4_g2_i2::g.74834::m.74834
MKQPTLFQVGMSAMSTRACAQVPTEPPMFTEEKDGWRCQVCSWAYTTGAMPIKKEFHFKNSISIPFQFYVYRYLILEPTLLRTHINFFSISPVVGYRSQYPDRKVWPGRLCDLRYSAECTGWDLTINDIKAILGEETETALKRKRQETPTSNKRRP